jgi:hypothetical protein
MTLPIETDNTRHLVLCEQNLLPSAFIWSGFMVQTYKKVVQQKAYTNELNSSGLGVWGRYGIQFDRTSSFKSRNTWTSKSSRKVK